MAPQVWARDADSTWLKNSLENVLKPSPAAIDMWRMSRNPIEELIKEEEENIQVFCARSRRRKRGSSLGTNFASREHEPALALIFSVPATTTRLWRSTAGAHERLTLYALRRMLSWLCTQVVCPNLYGVLHDGFRPRSVRPSNSVDNSSDLKRQSEE